jgi:hypothetical protein
LIDKPELLEGLINESDELVRFSLEAFKPPQSIKEEGKLER